MLQPDTWLPLLCVLFYRWFYVSPEFPGNRFLLSVTALNQQKKALLLKFLLIGYFLRKLDLFVHVGSLREHQISDEFKLN